VFVIHEKRGETFVRMRSAVFALLVSTSLLAQPQPQEFSITAEERKEAIEKSIQALKTAYVFPTTAAEMEKAVRTKLARGEYDNITSGVALAKMLTSDFQGVSRDKHLNVFAAAEGMPDSFSAQSLSPQQLAEYRVQAARTNFGFEKVERLQGNVGYIDIRLFEPPEVGAETGAAAMNFIANSDALIIDLRKNGGGEPAMIAFLTSYLFDTPTHLNDLYTEETKSTQQWWTSPHVPGPKFGGTKPVFVLTSDYTFSGGEEFAFNLKNLKRATLLGETTGGGAHPVRGFAAGKRFGINVPFARAINPITKTNWEGTGVTPDIFLDEAKAFDQAYLLALEAIVKTTDNPRRKAQLENLLKQKKGLS
jgi:hypothetical protein